MNATLKSKSLTIGKAGEIVFRLSNEGSEEVKNVLVSWKSDVLPPISSNSEFVKVLGPGESKTISFNVFVHEDAKPGYYSLPLAIKYDLPDGGEAVNRTFAVMVEGSITLTATLFRAEVEKVFISIANTGNAPVKNLVAYAISPYGKAEVFMNFPLAPVLTAMVAIFVAIVSVWYWKRK